MKWIFEMHTRKTKKICWIVPQEESHYSRVQIKLEKSSPLPAHQWLLWQRCKVKVLHYHPDERLRDLLAAKMEIPWKKRHYHLWEHYNQKWAKLNLKKITYFFFSHLIFFFQILSYHVKHIDIGEDILRIKTNITKWHHDL
jgi:hypothetical protein